MKAPKLQIKDGQAARKYRRKTELNQKEFWSKLGVTQSGGSRYESGREMPEPVQMLLNIAYGSNKCSAELVQYLRKQKEAPEESESK